MSARLDDQSDDLLTRFLLDELSKEERAGVEERFLADGDFFDRLLTIESSVLDEYAGNRLSAERERRARLLFESSPAQRRDLEHTKDIVALLRERRAALAADTNSGQAATYVADTRSPTAAHSSIAGRRSAGILPQIFLQRRLATALAVILALLLCGGLIYWSVRLNSQRRLLEQQQTAMERHNQEIQRQLDAESQGRREAIRQLEIEREQRARTEELLAQVRSHEPAGLSTLTLSPTIFERGTSPHTASLKPKTAQVRLILRLDPSQRYDQYSVTLTTFADVKVWSKSAILASQIKSGRLVITLPTSLLTYEDYRIELRGLSANGGSVHIADYVFKVRE